MARSAAGEAAGIAEQLCRALAHTHASGVIHRDIKPANVLLTQRGQVKLSDFSIARLAEGSSEGQATIAGTPKYMAPEQARGLPATPATDLYSVGVVLYEMLAGRPPFAAGTAVDLALRHLQEPPPPLPAHVPPALPSVVARALRKAPERRYPTAAAMVAALAAARVGDRTQAPTQKPSTAPPARGRRTDRRASDGDPRAGPPRVPTGRGWAPSSAPGATSTQPLAGARPRWWRSSPRSGSAMLFAAHLIGAVSRVSVPDTLGLTRGRGAARALPRRPHAALHQPLCQPPGRPGHRAVAGGQAPRDSRRRGAGGAERRAGARRAAPGDRRERRYGHRDPDPPRACTRASTSVPAPGSAPGTVTAQSPGAGQQRPAHSTVTLSVAQAPQWRTLSAFSGTDAGRSPVFHIEGQQWRVVYRMGYVGTCTFIVFCSGPNAHVRNLDTGQSTSFDLANGSHQSQTFTSGPGRYRIEVAPGNDTATWSIEIQDYY